MMVFGVIGEMQGGGWMVDAMVDVDGGFGIC